MSTAAERAAAERAEARAAWPVRKTTLAEQGADEDLRASTTAEERVAMMWRLAVDAFGEVPDYPRSEAPGRVIRPASG